MPSSVTSTRTPSLMRGAAMLCIPHRVTAELFAQRGDHLMGVSCRHTRIEPLVQRDAERSDGDPALDRVLDGPPAGTRVIHVVADAIEGVAFIPQRAREQFEEPRSNHGAVLPQLRHLTQIEVEVRPAHAFEPFANCLQHRVFDGVVDHLDEMTGAIRSDVRVTTTGRERLEHWLHAGHGFYGPANHQVEALLLPPHTPADTDVEKMHATFVTSNGVFDRRRVSRIAAIDEKIAGLQPSEQRLNRLRRWLAMRQHDPHGARRVQLSYEVLKRLRGGGPGARELVDLIPRQVITNNRMSTIE